MRVTRRAQAAEEAFRPLAEDGCPMIKA